MTRMNRTVIGLDENGKSKVIHHGVDTAPRDPEAPWNSVLWAVDGLPADNSTPGDRGGAILPAQFPKPAMVFRAVEIPPSPAEREEHVRMLQRLRKDVKLPYPPTEEDLARHPSMHRTDTLDFIMVARGEIYLVTDLDETLLKQGDTAIVRGVNHAWDNRSNGPCMIVGVTMSAMPLPADLSGTQ